MAQGTRLALSVSMRCAPPDRHARLLCAWGGVLGCLALLAGCFGEASPADREKSPSAVGPDRRGDAAATSGADAAVRSQHDAAGPSPTGLDAGAVDGRGDGSAVPGRDAGESADAAVSKLVHPGILNSARELAFIKTQVEAKREPWKSAFDALLRSPYGATSYKARPFRLVECGSYNKPNVGCTPFVEDGAAVYAHALLWSITRDRKHADKAIEILDAWSAVYEGNTESNARLTVAWAAPWYANGAEILRYSDAGLSEASILRFSDMLKKMLPYVQDNERPENNWIQARIEAQMAIAVFLDDPAELAAAVQRFTFWLPIYIYQESDGATPVNPPGRTTAQTASLWKGQAASTSYVDGLAMETCRDLGHLGLGVGSMLYAAETAWQQGIDLFTPHQKRLSDFLELHGSWTTGAVSVPASICGGVVRVRQADSVGIAPPEGGGRHAWEIAYGHLHDRLGAALPYTLAMIRDERPSGGAMWVSKWETLTHANRPPAQ